MSARERSRLEAMYAEADALERQIADRFERHPCCGERLDDGHHLMCSKRPTDEPPAHVEGQEALL